MQINMPHRIQACMPLMHNVDQALEKRVQRGGLHQLPAFRLLPLWDLTHGIGGFVNGSPRFFPSQTNQDVARVEQT